MTDLQKVLERLEKRLSEMLDKYRNAECTNPPHNLPDEGLFNSTCDSYCAVRREMREEDRVVYSNKDLSPPAEPSYCKCPPDQQHLNGKFCEFCTKMVEPEEGRAMIEGAPIDYQAIKDKFHTPAAKECECEEPDIEPNLASQTLCGKCFYPLPHPPEDKDG